MTAFTWRALRDQLAASPYLLPGDDISTQRGLVATPEVFSKGVAILQRMSDDTRHCTWTPERLWSFDKRSGRQTPGKPAHASSPELATDLPGGVKVAPATSPRVPRPGGMAVAVP